MPGFRRLKIDSICIPSQKPDIELENETLTNKKPTFFKRFSFGTNFFTPKENYPTTSRLIINKP